MEVIDAPKRHLSVPRKRSSSEKHGLGIKRRCQLQDELLDIRKHLNETSVLLENLIKTECPDHTLHNGIHYVDARAANFEVYSFLQKRANNILQNEMVASHDVELCPDTISIAAKRADCTFLNQFKTQDTSETFQSKIALFIGADDDLFDVFCRKAFPETTICRIQPNGQTGSDEREIIIEDWGFNSYGNDLTNDTTITECIDDVLERVVMEKLTSAAEAVREQGNGTGGVITEVKELFALSKVPMPNWLRECELDSETLAARKKLTKKMSWPQCGFLHTQKRKLDSGNMSFFDFLKGEPTDSGGRMSSEPLALRDVPDVAFVQTDAQDYPVYDYTQRRVQTAIEKSDSQLTFAILIASGYDTLRDVLSEKLKGNIWRKSTGNAPFVTSNSVLVYIGGDDDCFDYLRKTTRGKNSSLCRITPQSSSEDGAKKLAIRSTTLKNRIGAIKTTAMTPWIGNVGENIRREYWGFQCFAKDLSKDNICTYIDDILEHYAFEVLNRAAISQQASGNEKDGKRELKDENIAKMQSLYKKTKIPMPEWLAKWKPKENKWKDISNTVLSHPTVFGCDTSNAKLGILILKEKESKMQDLTRHLKSLGLSEDEFEIQVMEIQPLAGGKFESGDKIQVRGSNKFGTLTGFAILQKNNTNEREMVAVTAKHVVEASNQGRKIIHIDNENLGKVMESESTSSGPSYDIAIAKVTAPKKKCNSQFRFENGKDGFADLLEPENEHKEICEDERVHFWGAETSPGVAEISGLQLKSSDAGKYICIETHSTKDAFAKEGDSGAMVLIERSPRESDRMFAIGSLVGELLGPVEKESDVTIRSTRTQAKNITATTTNQGSLERSGLGSTSNETATQTRRYIVVPLEKAFQQLSDMHGGKLSLATAEDVV